MKMPPRPAQLLALAALLCAVALPADAQTELDLSATGQTIVPPDEMNASLQAQSTQADAASAQADINKAMKAALDLSRATPGVIATTGGYNVFQTTPDGASAPQFQASQSLQLVIPAPDGTAPASFNALVGQLQQNGLLLNNLDGDLSTAGQRAAQKAAIGDAIAQIQSQAAIVAEKLNVQVGEIKTLNLSVNAPGPVFRPMLAMAKMDATAAPPQSAPDNITIQANISATIELTAPH